MTRSFSALAAFVILSCSVSAQWPSHQADIPKGRDGKPDLAAPAPRTADRKPDLSGVWMTYVEPDVSGRPPHVRGGNAGAGFKDGLPFQPWAAALQKKRAAEGGLNDPDGLCLPQGPLQYHVDPQPLKIVQTPTQMLIIYESNYGLRTIYMDGRRLPLQGQPQPYWHGYSVGHRGSPYTEAMKVTERFRRLDYGHLDIEFTVDDPQAYTRPFTVRVSQQIVPDGSELIEFICHENQMFLKLTGRAQK